MVSLSGRLVTFRCFRLGLIFSFRFPELDKQVRDIFVLCVGDVDPEISTMELLKRIELRMESLTQDLESLPSEKVKIAQRVSFKIAC